MQTKLARVAIEGLVRPIVRCLHLKVERFTFDDWVWWDVVGPRAALGGRGVP